MHRELVTADRRTIKSLFFEFTIPRVLPFIGQTNKQLFFKDPLLLRVVEFR